MGTKHDEINARLAQHIQLKEVSWLKPYSRNARTHSSEQLDEIAASITEFGFVNPILAQGDGTIIAGHGRLEAATTRLGFKEVPVIVLDYLTETQARLLVLADNKIALNAGWDEELLAEELAALEDMGADLDLTGFDEDELADYLGLADEDEMPEMHDSDKPEFQQITFTLHNKQAEKVKAAIRAAAAIADEGLNDNANGNALAAIAQAFLDTIKENKKAEAKEAKKQTTKKPAAKKAPAKKK